MSSSYLDFFSKMSYNQANYNYRFKTRYKEDFIRLCVNEIVQAGISKYTVSIIKHNFGMAYEKAVETKKVTE